VVSFTLRLLYFLEKNIRCTLGRRLGGPHRWSGRGNKKKFLSLTGVEPRLLALYIEIERRRY
jgi:hypothetical protein